jgi:UDP-N-acetylglucosamine 2-epimerase (non-hydrolysing)
MKKFLFVYGTRPEAIKLAPLINIFKNLPDINVKICVTGQHREMLDQVNDFFEIIPDYDLDVMKSNQDLFDITVGILNNLKPILINYSPDLVIIQGDTTTVLATTLACYYLKIKVAHVEAGLRSGNLFSPFPEEMNRSVTARIANFNFTTSIESEMNLKNEGISEYIYNVGNTVVDSLHLTLDIIKRQGELKYAENFKYLNFDKKIILITSHRRESFGEPFKNICEALIEIAFKFPDIQIVFPVHLNPVVRDVAFNLLKDYSNIFLLDPLDYPNMIWILDKSYLVLTDSGGIQEEAPSLNKPLLVLRDFTERVEGINAGIAKLIGTNKDVIVSEVTKLLQDEIYYGNMISKINPYGDGTTSMKITNILMSYFKSELYL